MRKIIEIFLITIFLISSTPSLALTSLSREEQQTNHHYFYTTPSLLSTLRGNWLYVGGNGPGNYSKIQEAIDIASDNDTIFVYHGTYFENIIITKSIELIGEDKNTTIINGNGAGTVINISVNYVNISGFTIKNSSVESEGIKIRTNYNIIYDCNISSNKHYGLYLDANPTHNIIKFNTFFNNSFGIFTNNANLNNISSNTFTGNTDYGIYLSTSYDNLISDNKFTENNYGIRIKGSERNTITKNLIMNNNYGLYFCCGTLNNLAYNNVFIYNPEWNAYDRLGNTWDNGIIGNYWDDYTGIDADGNGIGDTPYTIVDEKIDNFPLMEPYFKSLPEPPKIKGQTNGKTGISYDYIFNAKDPDDDDVQYIIDWGDGNYDTTGLNSSGVDVIVKHTWAKKGTYIIKARAKDTYGLIGPEATLSVTMPKNIAMNMPLFLQKLFQRFPFIEKILKQILL